MRLTKTDMMMLAIIVFLVLTVVYPMVMIIIGSFKEGSPLLKAPYGVRGYVDAFTNPASYKTLWTTFWLSGVKSILCLIAAVFLAWVVTRTDTPGKSWFEIAMWILMFLPTQPLVMSWLLLASAPNGLLNLLVMKIFPSLQTPPFNIRSYTGIIWVSIQMSAAMFMLITPAFRGMDASLEESATTSGSGRVNTVLKITLPILMPAIMAAFLTGVVRLLASFEPELLLGYEKGIYVYTTTVYALTTQSPTDYPQAMALSSVFMIIIFILIIWQWQMLRGKSFTTVTGRGYRVRITRLGKWKWLTFGITLAFITIYVLIPVAVLFLGSFMKIFGLFTGNPWTLDPWKRVLSNPGIWTAVLNTVIVSAGTATLGTAVYALLMYIVVRTKLRGRKIIDVITWLPWGVPGLVLGLGFIWAYVGGFLPTKFLYGSMTILVLAFMVRCMPIGCRVMTGTMHQLGKELEESSRVHGGTWFYTISRIVFPLILPSAITVWILTFMLCASDLTTAVLLVGPKTKLLSVVILDYFLTWDRSEAVVAGVLNTFLILGIATVARMVGSKKEIAS